MSAQVNERNAEIAERLRRARLGVGLTQEQVSEQVGLSRPVISNLEAGKRALLAIELPVFADLYQVTIAHLLGLRPRAGKTH